MAFADQDVPGADWMPKEKVMQKLDAAGYTNVTGLQADDGYWEGKGVKNGRSPNSTLIRTAARSLRKKSITIDHKIAISL